MIIKSVLYIHAIIRILTRPLLTKTPLTNPVLTKPPLTKVLLTVEFSKYRQRSADILFHVTVHGHRQTRIWVAVQRHRLTGVRLWCWYYGSSTDIVYLSTRGSNLAAVLRTITGSPRSSNSSIYEWRASRALATPAIRCACHA